MASFRTRAPASFKRMLGSANRDLGPEFSDELIDLGKLRASLALPFVEIRQRIWGGWVAGVLTRVLANGLPHLEILAKPAAEFLCG